MMCTIRDKNSGQKLNFHFILAKGIPFPQISVGGDCSIPKTILMQGEGGGGEVN